MRTFKMALVAGTVALMSAGAFAQGAGGGAVSGPISGPNPEAQANNPNAPVTQEGRTTGMTTGSGMYNRTLKNERGKTGETNTQRPASDNMSK